MRLKHIHLLGDEDDDPLLSAVNLVDVFLVLVVALLIAVAVRTQRHAREDATAIRNAGQPDMEVVVREHGRAVKYRGAGTASAGDGVRAGVAYRLRDGSIVYVPEAADAAEGPGARQ
jgi:hypothetical protein